LKILKILEAGCSLGDPLLLDPRGIQGECIQGIPASLNLCASSLQVCITIHEARLPSSPFMSGSASLPSLYSSIPLFSNGVPTLHKPILAGIPTERKNWNKKNLDLRY
jgi:hypothetical protein